MKSINKTIAGICRRLRHLIGLTREKVAEETGLNLHDIVRAETGEENFSLEKLRKLADYYGVSMETLLSGNPEDIFGRAPDGKAREESRAANAHRAERAKEIGDIGEELSYRYEISRHMKAHTGFASEVDPSCAGRKRLGYDILSRELDGSALMIESKASRGPDKDDFHMSKREMERMREAMDKGENYLVYHWRNAESENPRLEILTPSEVFKMYDISVETYYLRRV
jgi:transcriptional regulator with XRE-family HTH domain